MNKFNKNRVSPSEGGFNTIKGLDMASLKDVAKETPKAPQKAPRTPAAKAAPGNSKPAARSNDSRNSDNRDRNSGGNRNYKNNGGNRSYNNNYRNDRNNSQGGDYQRREPRRPREPIKETVEASFERAAWFKRQAETRPRPGESVEGLIKRFKNKCEKAGILKEVRKREFHKTEGQIAREDHLKAEKRARKERAKQARWEKRG